MEEETSRIECWKGKLMKEKVQYEDDKLKVCAPASLIFIVNDMVKYFYEHYEKEGL